MSVGDGRRKRDVEEIEGELGQGITRRRAFLDIAGATGGTIVIEVLEDLAPRAGQLLRERFDSGQYMEGHAAALYPGTRVELVPKVGPTPFKGEVPPEDEGAVPPGNEEHGILSLNAHEERVRVSHFMIIIPFLFFFGSSGFVLLRNECLSLPACHYRLRFSLHLPITWIAPGDRCVRDSLLKRKNKTNKRKAYKARNARRREGLLMGMECWKGSAGLEQPASTSRPKASAWRRAGCFRG